MNQLIVNTTILSTYSLLRSYQMIMSQLNVHIMILSTYSLLRSY